MRIIDKTGPLTNPADRDHCLQYMTAIALIHGEAHRRALRRRRRQQTPASTRSATKMQVVENPQYTRDYLDPELRSIGNAVQVFFADGTSTEEVAIDFPVGHRRRRAEGIPQLRQKLADNVATGLPAAACDRMLALFDDPAALDAMPVRDWVDLSVAER